ncbi:hypothetical protein Asp14428_27580 [Actinoplanes sp. NBRC 14428]|uniref:Uncharacterized protein n=1 Tax=Pseudosporangium ferrugineum TaxID=439699 RepID=A0A2T0R751_9ACTN|nr:hypothetical protein [Pseudosporangium ferrugineum]PRY17005.1 hypothetical protein CLV70_1571 [Pseudosporangium ferrugineum]BCJ51283.1 hypothetical protein Asp14428_27580 [Actinoplanes sp. NBRC 14428]
MTTFLISTFLVALLVFLAASLNFPNENYKRGAKRARGEDSAQKGAQRVNFVPSESE